MNCNFTIHATCSLIFTTYKYNELQMSFATQKLNCKAICKTPFFKIVHPKPNAPNMSIKCDGGENPKGNFKGNLERNKIAHLQS